jgi:hypothetical protein
MKYYLILVFILVFINNCIDNNSKNELSKNTVLETDSTILIQGGTFEGIVFKENYVWHLRNVDRQVPILEMLPVSYIRGWTPTIENVIAIEVAFYSYWQGAMNDSLAIINNLYVLPYKEIHNLKRQYVGFIDSTNSRYVWINLLESGTLTSEWKSEPLIIEDGGYYKRSLIYNAEIDSIVKVLVF